MVPAVVIGSPVELLEELGRRGAIVYQDGNGGVLIRNAARDAVLSQACRRWRWALVWGVHAAERGYRWHVCGSCGALAPLAPRAGQRCRMTFGCAGKTTVVMGPTFAPGAPRAVEGVRQAR